MKKILLLAFLFSTLIVSSQVSISLSVNPFPTPELSQWTYQPDIAMLTVTNTNPALVGTSYKIKVKMYKDGGLVFESNNNVQTKQFTLGTEVFMTEDIVSYDAITIKNNSFKNTLITTGLLPAGNYSFCVSILDLNGNVISTPQEECRPMMITDFQLPELIHPIAGFEVLSDFVPALTFTWTPLAPVPNPAFGIRYIIAITEIQAGQTANQAFHVNYPLIQEEVIGNQFVWPSTIDAPTTEKTYVWSVKPIRDDGTPYKATANGFVNIETFRIRRNEVIEAPICECVRDYTLNMDNSPAMPDLVLTQPEPQVYPKKLSLGYTPVEIRNYLKGQYIAKCFGELDNYDVSVVINWSGDVKMNATNNGPFVHDYGTNDIPEQICVTYKVSPKPGFNGGQCEEDICIDVPASILALNTGNVPTGTLQVGDSLKAGENGEFVVLTTEITATAGTFSGKGTVYVNWLKARVAVEFTGITVDANRKLLTGIIKGQVYDVAPVYPIDWATEIAGNNAWLNSKASQVVTWVQNTSGQTIPYNGLLEYSTPVKMPLGVNFPNNDQFAITEMVFQPTKSEFNMVAAKNTPASWGTPQLVGFIAKKIKFHPSNIQLPPERIELIEDVTIGNVNNKITYTFKKPTPTNSGCYIEWNENGFSQFGLELHANFTRDWFLPVPDDSTSKSKATLSAVGSNWNEMILTGTLQESTIVGADGMIIKGDSLALDMSSSQNPGSIVFPAHYNGETTNLFRGFYMKEFMLDLGDNWKTHSNGAVKVSVQNMIIDDTGLTFYAEATNVLQYPNASVADMAASIDTVYVEMESASLVEAGLKGRVALPVSKADSIQNALKYHALFHNAQNPGEIDHFQLSITPTGPIYAQLFKSKMELSPTSNIIAYRDTNKRTFQSTLNGNFNWEDVTLGPVKNIKMKLNFQNVQMNYNSSLPKPSRFLFNQGTWAFASPQKFIANFPVTIEKIEFKQLTPTGDQILYGKLNFDVICNLSNDVGGQTKLAIEAAVEENPTGSGLGKFKPVFVGVKLDDVSIYAHLPAVSIDGKIEFRNNDPIYGNGFKGSLKVSFKPVKIEADAVVEFGNTSYQNSTPYRYWRVEAGVIFPPPGIPFLPGIAFRGFGGGAYNNMEATLTSGTYTFKPKKSNLGFIAKAVIATTPKEEAFNADAKLLAQFSTSGGLTYIAFSGDFYVGADLAAASRAKAKIKGNLSISYDPPQKHFMLSANVAVNASPIQTVNPANMVLDINGTTNKWFFKFGEPSNLNAVKVFGITLYEYLMFGNDIPVPNGFTSNYSAAYHGVMGSYPYAGGVGQGGVNSNSQTGKGFALGIGFKFVKLGQVNLTGNYYAGFGLAAGAELNLSYMNYLGACASFSPMGINGWRAKGNISFYGAASLSVQKIKNGEVKNTWNLASIKAGAWVAGEFPNPYYVAGALSGNISIGGVVNVNFNYQFEAGDKCNNSGAGNGSAVTQEDAAAEQEQLLVKYVNPLMSNNFPITSPLIVKYGLVPGESFDVAEQQANGSVINRVFRLDVTTTLQVQGTNGQYTNVATTKKENNLGEYLYIITTMNTATAASQGQLSSMSSAGPAISYSTPSALSTLSVMQTSSTGGYSSKNQPSATMSAIYPAPTPLNGEYDNLPPAPAPVLNTLQSNKNYKFVVTATLKEYKNGSWVNAMKKNNTPVIQTVTKTFYTGAMQYQSQTGSGPANNQGLN